jgi:CDP-diacylglycerol--serine O-phosphatidyltransferase
MMKLLMGGLAILMITNVPYPAFPKIGIRSWRGVAGLVVVVGAICGIFIYGRVFFFPAGMAYVLYGLVKTFALGLVDRIPTGAELEDEGDAYSGENGDLGAGPDLVVGRRRRRRRPRPRLLQRPGPRAAEPEEKGSD